MCSKYTKGNQTVGANISVTGVVFAMQQRHHYDCPCLTCTDMAITSPEASRLSLSEDLHRHGHDFTSCRLFKKILCKIWRHLFCLNVIYKYLCKLLCLNNICITQRFFSVLRFLTLLKGILIGANLLLRKIHIRYITNDSFLFFNVLSPAVPLL